MGRFVFVVVVVVIVVLCFRSKGHPLVVLFGICMNYVYRVK